MPGKTEKTAYRLLAEQGLCEFVLTSNQNLILVNISAETAEGGTILSEHGISIATTSGMRRSSIACVALPTCGLALAESER